ncbi:MAG TPA: FixH family protein [Jiangellaceae bacterium]|nr:FixH family protein [Jiangellaceae bacterium]
MHRITGMETRRRLPALAVIAVVAFVAACSQPPPQSLQADTPSYHVQLDLDAASLGRRTATIEVTDARGDPVDADQVVVTPVMAEMGMTRPALVADEVEPGRYRATGELFSMLGEWTLTVRIESAGADDEATFTVKADP